MNSNRRWTSVALIAGLLLCTGGAMAGPAKVTPPAKPAAKAPCPAANKVNTPAENDRGCMGAFVNGPAARDWVPVKEQDYLAQIKSSTVSYNLKFHKTYQPQGKDSYVPGQGNGGVRCPKYYKYMPRRGSNPIALHRVYDARGYPKAGQDGKYWTFRDEQWKGPKANEYRSHYAICTDWNNLTKHVGCQLTPGTVVAAGPGESMMRHLDNRGHCGSVCPAKIDEAYKTAADVQVVLHNATVLCTFTP